MSTVDLSLDIPRSEFFQLLADNTSEFYVSLPDNTRAQDGADLFITSLTDPLNLEVVYEPQNDFTKTWCPNWSVPEVSTAAAALYVPTGAPVPQLRDQGLRTGLNRQSRVFAVAASVIRSRLYLFRAERLNIGEAQIGTDPILTSNASNLPSVLHLLLSKNPPRFHRYLSYVNAVFPEIRQVTVLPTGGTVRLLLWSTDPKQEREDLAISLSESGTGISQVLAILYVVVTADYPRVFLIDEPQSFLHPGALRKLLAILASHPQHQYIISTHSPIVLTATNPSSVLLLRKDGAETLAQNVDPREAGDLRTILAEVGARLSDVFGADSVLWVEGLTEELCFPVIWEAARSEPEKVTATVILGVKHTSDFQRRDARATVELYRRLTQGGALLPAAVGFIFDRETRSKSEQDDLVRETDGRARFLRRRMFENYLLVPPAIATVANAIDSFRSERVTSEEIYSWLEQHRWDREYLSRDVTASHRTEELWCQEVHGSRLLESLFSDLSEGRVRYDKVRHGLELTKWICKHQPGHFEEIGTLIREAMKTRQE